MRGPPSREVGRAVKLRTYERRGRREFGARGKPVYREGDNPESG